MRALSRFKPKILRTTPDGRSSSMPSIKPSPARRATLDCSLRSSPGSRNRRMAVDEIADRLHARPARPRVTEKVPGDLAEPVGFDIAAADEVEQRVVRQIRNRDFSRIGDDEIGKAADFDDAGIGDREFAGRHEIFHDCRTRPHRATIRHAASMAAAS